MIGAAQGASCFGPAYEFALILDTELRKRRIRDKVPMTFVTPEPYIGHLGLDGVGDTKGLLESEMRNRHIKWITNARIKNVEAGKISVEEVDEDGSVKKASELPFSYAMILPAFRGVAAVRGVERLTNPRGFILAGKNQRNPNFPNIFSVGVCVAIAPVGPTPVPVGVPKTGFMIESMVTATAQNIGALLKGVAPTAEATWNAVCLADFGDDGIAFVAEPQIPPRNVNWSSQGAWVHYAKIAFEKFFLHKIRRGESEPFYERWIMETLGNTPADGLTKEDESMNIDRAVLAFAGLVVLAGLLLGWLYQPLVAAAQRLCRAQHVPGGFHGFLPGRHGVSPPGSSSRRSVPLG